MPDTNQRSLHIGYHTKLIGPIDVIAEIARLLAYCEEQDTTNIGTPTGTVTDAGAFDMTYTSLTTTKPLEYEVKPRAETYATKQEVDDLRAKAKAEEKRLTPGLRETYPYSFGSTAPGENFFTTKEAAVTRARAAWDESEARPKMIFHNGLAIGTSRDVEEPAD